MNTRKPANKADETKVLTMSRRRCCICFALEANDTIQPGQLAHLNRDPSRSTPDSLVFLCLRHHDQYDTRTSQSKGLTEAEVRQYRDELYRALRQRFGSRPFQSLEGSCPDERRSVTFAVAFPSTPIVLVTPISDKPCSYALSSVSTLGFTVNIWSTQGEPVGDVSFNWVACLDT
jgi:hypothetical protein